MGPFSLSLSDCFKDIQRNGADFEMIRDRIRYQLHENNPKNYLYGQAGTDIGDLVRSMFSTNEYPVQHQSTCISCNRTNTLEASSMDIIGSVIYIKNIRDMSSINKLFQTMQKKSETCAVCQSPTVITQRYDVIPNILRFMPSGHKVAVSKSVKILSISGPSTTLPVHGRIYLEGFHFTARVITPGKKFDFMMVKQLVVK